jgi:hypothetical protein
MRLMTSQSSALLVVTLSRPANPSACIARLCDHPTADRGDRGAWSGNVMCGLDQEQVAPWSNAVPVYFQAFVGPASVFCTATQIDVGLVMD